MLYIFLLFSFSSIAYSGNYAIFKDVTTRQPICYGKEYSSTYLKRNPNKFVKTIRVKLIKQGESQNKAVIVYMKLSKEQNSYIDRTNRFVYDQADGIFYKHCDIGSFYFSKVTPKKITLVNNGFYTSNNCKDEKDEIYLNPKKGGDKTIILTRLPKEFCK